MRQLRAGAELAFGSLVLLIGLAPPTLAGVDSIRWSNATAWPCVRSVAIKPFPVAGEFKGQRSAQSYMDQFVAVLSGQMRQAGLESIAIVSEPDSADAVFEGEFLTLSNGSRKARFWLGFGAGKSKCHVQLRAFLRDRTPLFVIEHARISAEGLDEDELAENVEEVATDIGKVLASNRGSCSPPLSTSVAQSPVIATPTGTPNAPAVIGNVSVESVPANAEVYLDGSLVGMTPLVDYPMAEGLRSIEVVRSGYGNWKRQLKVTGGAPARLVAELEAGTATSPTPVATPTPSPSPDPSPAITPEPSRELVVAPEVVIRTLPVGGTVYVNGVRQGIAGPLGLRFTFGREPVLLLTVFPGLGRVRHVLAVDDRGAREVTLRFE
jgi:hypothetical protein